ncbi:uncharacterized protein [Epargyreus clarus]|uniref:uncharacterized protein n=1 Tax=Epargyreus clarus TaxID=520877 RepID=UPI003C2AEA6D
MVPTHLKATRTIEFKPFRSATALSITTEKPAQSSKSTPELFSSCSHSTTSLADEPSASSFSTDGTLSMITTPWTTESWITDTSCEMDFAWSNSDISSLTVPPKTSTSYGTSTLLDTFSKTTLTIYSFKEIDDFDAESECIRPLNAERASDLSSTFSSWTIESFTSSGWLSDLSSNLVKVNYPWSPYTEFSFTDTYPSSLPSHSHFSFPSNISTTTKGTDFLSRLERTNEDHTVLVS